MSNQTVCDSPATKSLRIKSEEDRRSMKTSASSRRIIAPQLSAVLKCLARFSSTLFELMPMSFEVRTLRGRLVKAAMHSKKQSCQYSHMKPASRRDAKPSVPGELSSMAGRPGMELDT